MSRFTMEWRAACLKPYIMHVRVVPVSGRWLLLTCDYGINIRSRCAVAAITNILLAHFITQSILSIGMKREINVSSRLKLIGRDLLSKTN